MGLFSTAVSIQFKNSRAGKILMAAALAILGTCNLLPVFMDPELATQPMILSVVLAAFFAGVSICCFFPKIWLNRWFDCFLVALLALYAGKAFGWAMANWYDPLFYDFETNYVCRFGGR